jgi:Alpha-L-rhamnosidase N-terminal domain/Bacterial alpha-L-rhamnosidase concanavalin-like domain
MFIALLMITYQNGTTEFITSDPDSWSVGNSSLLFNNIYLGTKVDNRANVPGWNLPSFQPSTLWPLAVAVSDDLKPPGALVWQSIPSVKVQAEIAAYGPVYPGDGSIVYDLGVNIAGVVNVTVTGPVGAVLIARYGELVYPNGSVNGMTGVAGQIKSGNGGPCAPFIAFQQDEYVPADCVRICVCTQLFRCAGSHCEVTLAESGLSPSLHGMGSVTSLFGGSTTAQVNLSLNPSLDTSSTSMCLGFPRFLRPLRHRAFSAKVPL